MSRIDRLIAFALLAGVWYLALSYGNGATPEPQTVNREHKASRLDWDPLWVQHLPWHRG